MTGLKLFLCALSCCCSAAESCPTLRLHRLQHAKLPSSSLAPGVCSNSCPLRFHELSPARLLCLWDSTGKNTGMGWHSLLQGIFPTQGLNPGLLHCRQTLYRLSHTCKTKIQMEMQRQYFVCQLHCFILISRYKD